MEATDKPIELNDNCVNEIIAGLKRLRNKLNTQTYHKVNQLIIFVAKCSTLDNLYTYAELNQTDNYLTEVLEAY